MKKIISLLIISLITIGCIKKDLDKTNTSTYEKLDNNPLKVTVEITGKRNGYAYPIKITLFNQTDSTYGFWLMTCSFYDNFVFNTQEIQFYSQGCDSNFPELIELPSKKEHIIQGEVTLNDINTLKEQKNIQLGLILVAKEDYSYSSEGFIFEEKYQKKGIIWSKPIVFR